MPIDELLRVEDMALLADGVLFGHQRLVARASGGGVADQHQPFERGLAARRAQVRQ